MDMEKQTPELLRDKEVHSNAYIAISVDQKLFYLGLAIVGYLDRGVLSPQFPVVAVMVPYLQPELLQAVPLLWNCVMKYDVATGDCSHQLFYISEDKLEYCVTALAGGLRVRGDVDTCVSSHTLVHQRNRGCKALDNTSLELGEALKMFNVLVPWNGHSLRQHAQVLEERHPWSTRLIGTLIECSKLYATVKPK
jgi:hypothetical protein